MPHSDHPEFPQWGAVRPPCADTSGNLSPVRIPVFHVFVFCLGLAFGLGAPAHAGGTADPLLKLVPADAAVTLAVEDLRGHALEFAGSTLAEGLRRTPAVQDWLASDRFRGFQQAISKAEKVLGRTSRPFATTCSARRSC